jgi:hypothetical protein
MTARGVSAALQDQGISPGEGVAAALADDEQAELFAVEMREQAEALDNGAAPVTWSGIGRKPGSRNRSTSQVIDFITKTGVDPLVFWSRILSMTPEQVKDRFKFEALTDAVGFQAECAKNLAPYVHSRRPIAIDVATRRYEHVTLNFADPNSLDPADIDGGLIEGNAVGLAIEEIVENQELSDDDGDAVACPEGRMDGLSD